MRRIQFNLFGILVMLVLFMGCQHKPKKGERTDTPTSGTAYVAVDESFAPIIEQEISIFHMMYPDTKIVPQYVTEVDAVNRLLKCKDLWLAITSRRLTPEEKKSFNSRSYEPREIKIATDGLALIINKHNNDTLITVSQIRDILTGKVKRWKEIYPKSRLKDFLIVFDNPNSSTVRFAIDSICNGKPFGSNVKALSKNEQVIDFVSKTPNAIGIIGVNWLSDNNDSTKLSFSKKIHVMSVSNALEADPANSWKPYQAYIYDKSYPLTRSIYCILNDPGFGLPWAFEAFLAKDRGQRIILKSGLVPETQPVRIVNVNGGNN
ncbi:MAG: phosphate ABC transporter substrate-binding protein [Bacteroidales bacterium]|nr:phosphate ABC transporter substrate-binding protein [Bacteroidales bacterium]